MTKRRRKSRPRPQPKLAPASAAPEAEPTPESAGASRRAEAEELPRLGRSVEVKIAAVLLALCALNLFAAAVQNSAVCDELGAHIPAGFLYWRSGQYSGGIDNFPLAQLWIAAPVALSGLDYELFTEQHLLLFRLPVMVLGLVLMVAVWRFARDLAGPLGGLAALGLASLSPNLLAHSTLATLDLPTTCAIFAAVFLLYRYASAPSLARLVAAAAAIAAALAIKIQAVLLLPLAALALVLAAVRRRRSGSGIPPLMVLSWLLIPAVAVVVIDLVYLHLPGLGGGLLPPAYLDAFRTKLIHGGGGHFAYLLGRYSTSGWWYYFPVAVLVKTPLPVLLLAAAGLVRRLRADVVALVLLPIAVFLGAGIAGHVNIGLRHVLPIYPFLYLLAGAGAARLLAAASFGRVAAVALMTAQALSALWIQPHHLSYFNLLVGGSHNGYRVLLDSNFDWGQNDRFLAAHVARTGLDYRIDPDPFRTCSGPILINANALFGILNGGPAAYRWLREVDPVDRIAYTWFEYDLPGEGVDEPDPAAVRLDRLGAYLADLRLNEPASRDPRVRFPLARALAAVTLYGPAFDEVRAILADDPADEIAFRFGAELIVRHKLGVLRYRGQEYLDGFRPLPQPAPLVPAELVRLARDSGTTEELSTLQTAIGFVRASDRDLAGALESFRTAVALDPANRVARQNLADLEAVAARER